MAVEILTYKAFVLQGRLHIECDGEMPPHQLLFEQTRAGSPQMYFSTGSRRGHAPHLTAGHTRVVQLQPPDTLAWSNSGAGQRATLRPNSFCQVSVQKIKG
jgi:hypothetical protein